MQREGEQKKVDVAESRRGREGGWMERNERAGWKEGKDERG